MQFSHFILLFAALISVPLPSVDGSYAYSSQGQYLPSAHYPVPALTLYTVPGFQQFLVHNDIFFDFSNSFHPDTSHNKSALYFLLQVGEYDAVGKPLWFLMNRDSTGAHIPRPLVYAYAYSTIGKKTVNVTMSDRPFIDDGSGDVPYSLTLTGLPPPVLKAEFEIRSMTNCFQFAVEVEDLDSNDSPRLLIRVQDPSKFNSLAAEKELAKALASVGENPMIVVSNLTHTYDLDTIFDLTESAWVCDIPKEYIDSTSPPSALVRSMGGSILGCSIAPLKVNLIPFHLRRFIMGFDMLKEDNGTQLIAGEFRPSRFMQIDNHCMRRDIIIPLGNSQSNANYMGAFMFFSDDGFDHEYGKLLDLLRTPNGSRIPDETTLCQKSSYSLCKNLTIIEAILLQPNLFILTTDGLFASSNFIHTSTNKFRKLEPKVDGVDVSINYAYQTGLYGTVDCLLEDARYLYLTYSSNATTYFDQLLISDGKSDVSDSWLNGPSMYGMALDSSYSFVSVKRDFSRQTNVLLIGKRVAHCCGIPNSNQCCYTNARVYSYTSGNATLLHTFPTTAYMVGMAFHDDGMDLFVYGSEVWQSSNGLYFHHLYTLHSSNQWPLSEVFMDFQSSKSESVFTLLSNFHSLYFGRAPAAKIIKVHTLSGVDPNYGVKYPFMRSITVDEEGEISWLEIPVAYNYSTVASDYPLSFLSNINGSLLPMAPRSLTKQSLIKKYSISINSFLDIFDWSPPSDLVPVFLSQGGLRIYVRNANSATDQFYFTEDHLDLLVTQKLEGLVDKNTPRMRILQVSPDGSYADTEVLKDLPFITSSDRATLQFDLTLNVTEDSVFQPPSFLSFSRLSSSAVSAYVTSQTSTNMVTLRLTTNSVQTSTASVSTGWRTDDVGKTVIIQGDEGSGGSIYLTQYIDRSTMIGEMYKIPTLAPGSTLNTTNSFDAGGWYLYDFKGSSSLTIEVGVGASLTVGTVQADFTATCTLSGASAIVPAQWQGKMLVAGSGVSVIIKVTGSTTFKTSFFSSISAGLYADGSWQIYDADVNYDYGVQFSVSDVSASWSLTLDDCSYSYLSSNATAGLLYLSNDESSMMSTTILPTIYDGANDQNLLIQTQLSARMRNPNVVKAKVVNFTVGDMGDLSRRIDLQMSSLPNTGFTTLSIKPTYVSLKCEYVPEPIRIYNHCPPYVTYGQYLPVSFKDFLYGSPDLFTHEEGYTYLYVLPKNYRPPSPLGHSIPTSKYIYNADPSAPRYNDIFAVSQRTGSYQACNGKTKKEDCQCTDYQKYSSSPMDTDCNERVVTAYFDRLYWPKISILRKRKFDGFLDSKFSIKEINGRTDWCLSYMTDCGRQSVDISTAVVDPAKNHSIVWMGSELYHFEINVLEGTQCELKEYLKIYVIHPPLRGKYEQMVTAITAMVFWIILVALYLNIAYRQG